MTRAPQPIAPANAPAAHFDPEPFADVAFPLWEPGRVFPLGVCQNPYCSKTFAPTRSWQRYCSTACRKTDEQEMRRVGQKIAPALLAWRMGKHNRLRTADGVVDVTEDMRGLSRVARSYISRVQSEWYLDRVARASERMSDV